MPKEKTKVLCFSCEERETCKGLCPAVKNDLKNNAWTREESRETLQSGSGTGDNSPNASGSPNTMLDMLSFHKGNDELKEAMTTIQDGRVYNFPELKPVQNKILWSFENLGLSYKAIAHREGLKKSQVRGHLLRSRNKIKKIYGDDAGDLLLDKIRKFQKKKKKKTAPEKTIQAMTRPEWSDFFNNEVEEIKKKYRRPKKSVGAKAGSDEKSREGFRLPAHTTITRPGGEEQGSLLYSENLKMYEKGRKKKAILRKKADLFSNSKKQLLKG
jgi:hypothetical protein